MLQRPMLNETEEPIGIPFFSSFIDNFVLCRSAIYPDFSLAFFPLATILLSSKAVWPGAKQMINSWSSKQE